MTIDQLHRGTATDDLTIRPSELRRLLLDEPDIRVLDVRTGGEFTSAHIPGSFNVPLDLLGEHVHRVGAGLAGLEHPVVLVCQSGARAATAHRKLNAASTLNLRVLEGGIGAWQAAGGDVVTGAEKWSLERQVRLVAGSIVLGATLASLRAPATRFVAGGVGLGLTVAALTNSCLMGTMLAKLPYNRGPKCDLDCVIDGMLEPRGAWSPDSAGA